MRRSTRLLAAGALSAVVLSGCGDESSSSKSSTAASSAATPLTVAADKVAPMNAIKVDTKNAKTPKVTLAKKPFQVNKTTVTTVSKGTGAAVKPTDIAYVSYVAVNGTDGKQLVNTYDKPDVAVLMDDKTQFPGLVTALKGATTGSVLDVAIPPAEGFGGAGSQALGVTAKDTLIFRMTVKGAAAPLDKPDGTAVAPKADLPTVVVSDGNQSKKAATITMPKKDGKVVKAPTKLVSQDLLAGKGRKIVAGQTVRLRYTGVIWDSGKAFDSSAVSGKGETVDFPMTKADPKNPAAGGMIPGFVDGIVGKTVGSRVLIVIPPAQGYGSTGNTQAGIKGTDTLVFVVDVLAAL